MAALVGPDGVFLVDSQFARVTDKIVAAIAGVSPVAAQVPRQHTRPRRSHGRQRELRQCRRHDSRPAESARAALAAAAGSGQRASAARRAARSVADRAVRRPDDGVLEWRDGAARAAQPGTYRRRHGREIRASGRSDDGRRVPLGGLSRPQPSRTAAACSARSKRSIVSSRCLGRTPRWFRVTGPSSTKPRSSSIATWPSPCATAWLKLCATARAPTTFELRSRRRTSSSEWAGRRTSSRSSSMGSSRSSAHNAVSRRRDHAAPFGLSARRRRAARNARRADSGARPPDSFPQLRTRSGRSTGGRSLSRARSCSADP